MRVVVLLGVFAVSTILLTGRGGSVCPVPAREALALGRKPRGELKKRQKEPAPAEKPAAPAEKQTDEKPEQAAEEAEGEQKEKWQPPRFEERRGERHRMVRTRIARGAPGREVGDERVLEAMRRVPRHRFVPEERRDAAYRDQPLPIGHGQTISQPYVVAFMTEKLRLEEGEKVLEIGTGSGYQAAVLSELTPKVYTIEIIEELAELARERLKRLGYSPPVKVRQGDGYYGWEEHAPFDAVIVTAAAGHVPPPLLKQLKPGGRMIIPVGGTFQVQRLILITKDEEGQTRSESLMPVRFVPMTGRVRKDE